MPRGKRNNPNLPNIATIEDTHKASKVLSDMLPLLDLSGDKSPVYDSPQKVQETISEYLKTCAVKGLRPGIVGLCSCIGLSYKEYRNELNGWSHKVNNETMRIIKRAHIFIDTYIEQCGAQGLLNPATLIFWQKNYTGLTDTQDISITPKADIQATKSLEQIERDIPIDE